jgi:hypothetical protein
VKTIQEQKYKLFPLLANTVLLGEIRKRGLGETLIVGNFWGLRLQSTTLGPLFGSPHQASRDSRYIVQAREALLPFAKILAMYCTKMVTVGVLSMRLSPWL